MDSIARKGGASMTTDVRHEVRAETQPGRPGRVWVVAAIIGVLAFSVGLVAGYLLFSGDTDETNAEIEDYDEVVALIDAWVDAWNNDDVDAIRAMMTPDGMAYKHRADAEGTDSLEFATERSFAEYTYEPMGEPLVARTMGERPLSYAYNATVKTRYYDESTGQEVGHGIEFFYLVQDEDGNWEVHHASSLGHEMLRVAGL